MKKIKLMIAATAAAFAVWSCTEEQNTGPESPVPQTVLEAFAGMYPGASNVDWSSKDIYWVATFDNAGTRAVLSPSGRNSAWYDDSGKWYMTERSYGVDLLPDAVKNAFYASEYASWRVEDVDYILRNGVEEVYVIEVEGEKDGIRMEVDLYYSATGVLVKTVVDASDDYDYGDFIPSAPSSGIGAFISEKYPSARIIDIESDYAGTEVEILDGRLVRELYFDRSGNWIMTKTELRYQDLPAAVATAVETGYASYRVSDIDYYETADYGNYYKVELDSRNGDIDVIFNEDGTEAWSSRPGNPGNPGTPENPGDPGNPENPGTPDNPDTPGYPGTPDRPGHDGGAGNPGTDAVNEFIQSRYPGAVVLEREYDDGFYEVEIRHDGRVKDVFFNGRKEWVKTEWDVRYSELPEAVKNVLDTRYSSYFVDDLTFVETSDSEYYLVELEGRGDREMRIRIAPDGTELR